MFFSLLTRRSLVATRAFSTRPPPPALSPPPFKLQHQLYGSRRVVSMGGVSPHSPNLLLDRLPGSSEGGFLTHALQLDKHLSPQIPVHLLGILASGKSRTLAELSCLRFALYLHPDHLDVRRLFTAPEEEGEPEYPLEIQLLALLLRRLERLLALLRAFGGQLTPADWLLAQVFPKTFLAPGPSLRMRTMKLSALNSRVSALLGDLEKVGVTQLPVLVDDGDVLNQHFTEHIGPIDHDGGSLISRLAKVIQAHSLPMCVSSAQANLDIAGIETQVFSKLPTYSLGGDAWDQYAFRYLEESDKETFIREAFPWLKGRAGFVAEFCTEVLVRQNFSATVQILKGNRTWTVIDVETLYEAIRLHGPRWCYIGENYFPDRLPQAILRKYTELRNSDPTAPLSAFPYKNRTLKKKKEKNSLLLYNKI